jgi:hypothetical protein
MVFGGCSGDGESGDRLDESRPEGPGSAGLREVPDPRRLRPIDSDDPGGPAHSRAVAAEPRAEEIQSASSGPTSRSGAEVFATVLSHAVLDQTDDSVGDEFRSFLVDDIADAVIQQIEFRRQFPGNRVVPSSRSWIRSAALSRPDGAPAYSVYLIQKVSGPSVVQAGQDVTGWVASRLDVVREGGRWLMDDYQMTTASEYERPSAPVWEGTFDSGRGWRRVPVG